jgi:hypothetical protein
MTLGVTSHPLQIGGIFETVPAVYGTTRSTSLVYSDTSNTRCKTSKHLLVVFVVGIDLIIHILSKYKL